jgi:methanogenic corrinoid protein MtbC1
MPKTTIAGALMDETQVNQVMDDIMRNNKGDTEEVKREVVDSFIKRFDNYAEAYRIVCNTILILIGA